MNSNFFGWSASFLCLFLYVYLYFVRGYLFACSSLPLYYLFVCLSVYSLVPVSAFFSSKVLFEFDFFFSVVAVAVAVIIKRGLKVVVLVVVVAAAVVIFSIAECIKFGGQIKNYQFWRQAEQQKNKLEKRFFRKMLEMKQLEKAVMS